MIFEITLALLWYMFWQTDVLSGTAGKGGRERGPWNKEGCAGARWLTIAKPQCMKNTM